MGHNWRAWYLLLLSIPVVLGNHNVRSGGDFLPAFVAGLIPVGIVITLVEIVALVIRRVQRSRASGK